VKLEGSLAKARAIGPGQAAKARDLHYDLENELEHGVYSEDESDEAENALAHLEEHHAGVRQASRAVTRPPNLSRPAKQHLEPREPEREEPEQGGEEPASPSPRPRPRSSSGSSSSRGRRAGGSGGRVFERAAGFSGEDISGAIITGLQFLLAAGLVYQVLQPKGAGAFSSILDDVGAGFRLIVDPVDPLGSSQSQIQQGFAQSAAAVAAAKAAAPAGGLMDTPTGTAPFQPPTFGNLPGGLMDTPGGTALFQPPTNIPVTGNPNLAPGGFRLPVPVLPTF
jgi:hypothetical protein